MNTAHMFVEISAVGEAAPTHVTSVGFLARVQTFVFREVSRVPEALPAELTHERFLVHVVSHVDLQPALRHVRLVTQCATEFVTRMKTLVSLQHVRGLKRSIAYITYKWTFPRVEFIVNVQLTLFRKLFPTDFTRTNILPLLNTVTITIFFL